MKTWRKWRECRGVMTADGVEAVEVCGGRQVWGGFERLGWDCSESVQHSNVLTIVQNVAVVSPWSGVFRSSPR